MGLMFFKNNPHFLRLWIGQILSQSGGRMYQMAVIWRIVSLGTTSSGRSVGLFMVMTALPGILFFKKIGAQVERVSAKKLLVSCDTAAAILLSCLSLLLEEEPSWLSASLFGFGFFASCLQSIVDPTLNKSVEQVVRPEDLEKGVSLLATTQSVANFLGAMLGAALIAWIGIPHTVGLAALGYLIAALFSSSVTFKKNDSSSILPSSGGDGWELLASFPLIKKLLFIFAFINFFATPTLVVLPIYTSQVLGAGASVLGLLEASLWVGLLFGAYFANQVHGTNALKTGALCMYLFGSLLCLPGIIVSPFVYAAALFVAGAALGVNNVKFMTYFQLVLPSEIKGRFFAMMQGAISFTFPVAYFLFGTLLDLVSVQLVCIMQGVGVIVVASQLQLLSSREAA